MYRGECGGGLFGGDLEENVAESVGFWIAELLAGLVGQVEHVDRPLPVGRDVRRVNDMPFVVDRARQPREQRRAVARIDFDDGRPARRGLRDQHARRDAKGYCAIVALANRKRGYLAIERRRDCFDEAFAEPSVGIGPALAIVNQQIVECHAVVGGVDAGIEDAGASRSEPGGDAMEQPG